MLQAQRNVSGPMRQQEQQVGAPGWLSRVPCRLRAPLTYRCPLMSCHLPWFLPCSASPLKSLGAARVWEEVGPERWWLRRQAGCPSQPADGASRPQVARTITNLQQQIQQHQRQLAQARLGKPPPPPPPHLSLHPSAGKSALDSFPPHAQAPGLPDLQTKEQQSSPNTFAPYPLGESGVCAGHVRLRGRQSRMDVRSRQSPSCPAALCRAGVPLRPACSQAPAFPSRGQGVRGQGDRFSTAASAPPASLVPSSLNRRDQHRCAGFHHPGAS